MYETNKRDYTLGEWLDIWLEEIAPTKRKPNTISIYRDARRRLLTHHPEAADILLVELNALQVEGWLDSMRQKYAKSTLRHIRVMLNQAYKSAKPHAQNSRKQNRGRCPSSPCFARSRRYTLHDPVQYRV